MMRLLAVLSLGLAAIAAAPASAYTPNPEEVRPRPPFCLRCILLKLDRSTVVVNPAVKFRPGTRFDGVLLNPQPLPPKALVR
jgi:hypothetical protein